MERAIPPHFPKRPITAGIREGAHTTRRKILSMRCPKENNYAIIAVLLCCCRCYCRRRTRDQNKLTATSLVRLDALSAGVAGTIYSRQYPSHAEKGEAGKDSRTKRQNAGSSRRLSSRITALPTDRTLFPSLDFYSVFYPL